MGLSILVGKPYWLTQTSLCIYTYKYPISIFQDHPSHKKATTKTPRSFLQHHPVIAKTTVSGVEDRGAVFHAFAVLQRLASNVVPRVAQRWA